MQATSDNCARDIPAEEVARAKAAGIEPRNAGLAIMTLARSYGVDTVFGIPGTHNLEFYRPLRRLGIHAVTTRHEQGAGFAADGWTQRTRIPGVVVTTSGPGLLNALSAIGNAYAESRPLLVLSPGPARGQERADIGTMHETKDQTRAADSIAAWARRVGSADEAVAAVHDAFALFRTARPRPVVIEVPMDVLEGKTSVRASELVARPTPAPARAEAAAVAAAAEALRHAAHPAILAGGGAVGARAPLRRLAERLGAPVVTTMNGKGVLPESHPLSLGAELRLKATRKLLDNADVLLVVGSKCAEARLWGAQLQPRGKVIRVDISPTQTSKNIAAAIPLVGDAGAVLGQLDDALRDGQRAQRAPDLASVRAELAAEAPLYAPAAYALATRIASALPHDVIIAGDSSRIAYGGMASVVHPDEPGAFLYTPTFATLGYGLPAAIGAKIAEPTRQVVGVIGDGALMFSIQELQTAVEQRLDLTIICADNGGYREIRQNEMDRGISPIGVDLAQPDWAALATAFGGTGFEATTDERLESVIREAVATKGVTLVHVALDGPA